MDEGIKRKLVGSAVLLLVAFLVVPMILPKAKNASSLSSQVPVEANVPNMDMALPKSLSLQSNEVEQTPRVVTIPDIEVDGKRQKGTEISVEPVASDGQAPLWQIRVGSFANAKNATSLRDALREKGYKAFAQLSKDEQYTRVFIGPSTQKTWLNDQLSVLEKEFGVKGEIKPFAQ